MSIRKPGCGSSVFEGAWCRGQARVTCVLPSPPADSGDRGRGHQAPRQCWGPKGRSQQVAREKRPESQKWAWGPCSRSPEVRGAFWPDLLHGVQKAEAPEKQASPESGGPGVRTAQPLELLVGGDRHGWPSPGWGRRWPGLWIRKECSFGPQPTCRASSSETGWLVGRDLYPSWLWSSVLGGRCQSQNVL